MRMPSPDTNVLTVQRVRNHLLQTYRSHIDMSDVNDTDPEKREQKFLTRSLAAFSVAAITEADPKSTGSCVTDGHGDGGVDAIFTDIANKTIYLVQSKWSGGGTKTIELGDCLKFLEGVNGLIGAQFSKFNDKVKRRESEIRANLLERADMRIVLVLVCTGSSQIDTAIVDKVNEWMASQNNVGDRDVFSLDTFNLTRIYATIRGETRISAQVALKHWGTVEDPYRAYYGMMTVQDIALWAKFGQPLMDKNIRFYRGSTDVNMSLGSTLSGNPSHFWYYNNGITLLCDKVQKTLLHGSSREVGVFDCEGMSVVNGGQTVGVIWERQRMDPAGFEKLMADVSVRIISLEQSPPEFANSVARATNTQNRIQPIDFAALDPNQHRLAHDMELTGRRYAFKTGDEQPRGDKGCGIEEAAVALACSSADLSLSVQAKREVGRLWSDTSREPYTAIFRDGLTAEHLWRSVRILRAVNDAIDAYDKDKYVRGELVAIHGNRFILHKIFQKPGVREFRDSRATDENLIDSATAETAKVFAILAVSVEILFSSAYLANLFKNAQKCEILSNFVSQVEDPMSSARAQYERWVTITNPRLSPDMKYLAGRRGPGSIPAS